MKFNILPYKTRFKRHPGAFMPREIEYLIPDSSEPFKISLSNFDLFSRYQGKTTSNVFLPQKNTFRTI